MTGPSAAVRRQGLWLLVSGVILVFGAWAAFDIAQGMLPGHPLQVVDRWTFTAFQRLRTPAWDQVMVSLTECGDAGVVWGVALAAGGWLAWRRAFRSLVYGLAAVGGGALINTTVKLCVHRARPTDLHFSGASLYSFPSGHSTTNTLLYGFLIVLVWRISARRRAALAAACGVFVGAICISRLYLGAHWLSDVAGGLLCGAVWLGLVSRLYGVRPAPDVAPPGLLVTVAIALVACSGVNILVNHAADVARYAHPAPQATTALERRE